MGLPRFFLVPSSPSCYELIQKYVDTVISSSPIRDRVMFRSAHISCLTEGRKFKLKPTLSVSLEFLSQKEKISVRISVNHRFTRFLPPYLPLL